MSNKGKKYRGKNTTAPLEIEQRATTTRQDDVGAQLDVDRILSLFMTALKGHLESLNLATSEDIKKLDKTVTGIKDENKRLREEVENLTAENEDIRRRLEYLEKQNSKNKICISGLPDVRGGADLHAHVQNFLNNIAGESVAVSSVQERESAVYTSEGNPLVVVELVHSNQVLPILKCAQRFPNVRIRRFMNPVARENCNRMLRLRWELKTRCSDAKAYISYDTLKFNGKIYEWRRDRLRCSGADGVQTLLQETGVDFATIIKEIVNYRRLTKEEDNQP